jgi:hypothetical protein
MNGRSCDSHDLAFLKPCLNWIQAFLTDRTQTVVIDGVTSNTVPVTSGVPRGTVLGPILFLIYINDFPEYLTHSKLRLFADDSIMYKEITCQDDCKKLQSDLDAAARWEADWLMAFHPDKCTVLTITQKKTPFKHDYGDLKWSPDPSPTHAPPNHKSWIRP